MKGTDNQLLSDQVRRKFIESIDLDDIEVLTDTGWSKVKKSHKTIEYERWVLKTTRHNLECADTHIVFRSNTDNEVLDEVYVKDLEHGDCIYVDDGYDVVTEVYNTEESENMYDLELDDENHRFYTNGILSHNSATTRGFLLWYMIFHQDKVLAILANKLKLATEQLTQLKDSYINLPQWLQPGIEEWSKTQIKLANGTRLITAATSPDGIRGFSIDVLYLDEFAFIDDHIMDDFIASVFPVVSSGKTTKIIITSTPNGMNGFYDMWRKAETGKSDFIPKQIMWNAVPGRTEEWARKERANIGEIRFNQEYRCAFLGSVSTLIDSQYLQKMEAKPQLTLPGVREEMRIFSPPLHYKKLEVNDWEYVACLDSGMGLHKDSTVLQIFLVKSNIECEQVVTFASNKLDIEEFCKEANKLLKLYHMPGLIIEQNGVGMVALNFFERAEYDNLLHFDESGRKLGLISSAPIKERACVLFKSYIEKNLMKLNDETTIQEMMSFGKKGSSWEGLGGKHDDHVLACVWVCYYLTSDMFYGNIIEEDIRSLPDDPVILKSFEEFNMEADALLGGDRNEEIQDAAKYSEDVHAIEEAEADDYSPVIRT